MFKSKIIASFFSILSVVGCGAGKGENLVVNPPKVNVPSTPTNLKSEVFLATKNNEGEYTTFKGVWVVPESVTSVKIIGCSGGNGGGGGGAGGAGAKFFTGNWSGASLGGDASSGGYANNKADPNSIAGSLGSLGRYKDSNSNQWFNAIRSNGGYPQAQSATVLGEPGGLGEQSFFGNYKFSSSSENLTNKDNILKIKTYVSEVAVCLGAVGGAGGSGGVGGEATIDNIGDGLTRYFVGGKGGRGGNGGAGFNAVVEEATIKVTPGESIEIQVGAGGLGGKGSSQITGGQSGSFGTNGQNGGAGANGQTGKPGAIYIQWIGL